MELGKVFITTKVYETVPLVDLYKSLVKFENRDFGYIDKDDRKINAYSMLIKGRVLGMYTTSKGDKFYIQLEAGHLTTTIILVEEY